LIVEANLEDVLGCHPVLNKGLGAVLELIGLASEEGVEEPSAELPEEKAVFPENPNSERDADEPS
jgi:hypothetical protein